MSERSNVIGLHTVGQLPRGLVDPVLTEDAARLRRIMGIDRMEGIHSNDVIVSPGHDAYEPHIVVNAAVHLGQPGIEDFEEVFGHIEGVNPVQLLVVYSVIKHGLTRRHMLPIREKDPIQRQLDALRPETRPLIPAGGISRGKAWYDAEILGVAAARMATAKAMAGGKTPQEKAMIPGLIVSAAEMSKPRSLSKVDPDHREVRKNVMSHFAVEVGSAHKDQLLALVSNPQARPKK